MLEFKQPQFLKLYIERNTELQKKKRKIKVAKSKNKMLIKKQCYTW